MQDRANTNAHIVGGGIAGVAASACLARAGFRVTLFERSSELREIGAGIFLKENSLRVLEELGQLDRLLNKATRIATSELWSTGAKKILTRNTSEYRTYVLPRQELHAALIDAALAAGVRIETGAEVTSATAAGDLHFSDGRHLGADLTIGADGVHSAVRDSLGLGVDVRDSGAGSWRVLIPSQPGDPDSGVIEYWSGNRRVLVVPSGKGFTYICASSRDEDALSGDVFDVADWRGAFPEFSDLLARIPIEAMTRRRHVRTWVNSWREGRVAILGDAVHGQPPNLGQGAGLGISNAASLARHVASAATLEDGLREWEQAERAFTEEVQEWSSLYDYVVHSWPGVFEAEREVFVRAMGESKKTRSRWLAYGQGLPELAVVA